MRGLDLARARRLARHAGLRFIELPPLAAAADPALARSVSPWVAWEYRLLPLELAGDRLVVATDDVRGREGPALVRALTGKSVEVVLTTSEDLERRFRELYGALDADDAAIETGLPEREDVHPGRGGARPRLGEILVGRGQVSEDEVAAALEEQEHIGGELGEILVRTGALTRRQLTDAIGSQLRETVAQLSAIRPDAAAISLIPERIARVYRIVPLAVHKDTLFVATDGPIGESAAAEIRTHTELRLRPLLAPRDEVDRMIARVYREAQVQVATADLLNRSPDESALHVLSWPQRVVLTAFLAGLAVAAVLHPIGTLIGFNLATSAFYGAFSIYKAKMIYDALGHEFELPVSDQELASLDDLELPLYTILVPLYHEAAVVPKLVGSLARLDYPQSKLDVRLITEEDDDETRTAIAALRLPANFKTLVVPDAQPKTKPKACNYALLQAEGRYVVIYDAEDQPEPDQLKKVVVAFRKARPEVVCIQCKLNYFNRTQNLLTRWFTLEYSAWFDLFMPGLDAANAPIPLGGTSNHLDRDRLIEVGAWDPFNVTEDCDLGVRLHKAGYRTAIVDSTTYEEANSDLGNWIRQRSRWVKGYVQTWLVHMRHPLRLADQVGWPAWISFQLVVGGTVVGFLLNPIYWGLTAVWILTHAHVIREIFPSIVFWLSALGLFVGNFAFIYVSVAGALRRDYYGLVKYALLSPLYWALMSVGAWKGTLQLLYRPHYWEKTIHGLDLPSRESAA